jgi:hypothetical protein
MMSGLIGIATVQFFEIAPAVKGYGERMVQGILKSIPDDCVAAVAMDNSGGSHLILNFKQIVQIDALSGIFFNDL